MFGELGTFKILVVKWKYLRYQIPMDPLRFCNFVIFVPVFRQNFRKYIKMIFFICVIFTAVTKIIFILETDNKKMVFFHCMKTKKIIFLYAESNKKMIFLKKMPNENHFHENRCDFFNFRSCAPSFLEQRAMILLYHSSDFQC